MQQSTYSVTGMSCSHCENAVRDEVSRIPGILEVSVDAATGSLAVTSESVVDDAAVLAAVDEAGYEATRAERT